MDHKDCIFPDCQITGDWAGKACEHSCNGMDNMEEPNGTDNLKAIVADQPYQNSPLTCSEILMILENKGGFMPDEAVVWFREWRDRPSVIRADQ